MTTAARCCNNKGVGHATIRLGTATTEASSVLQDGGVLLRERRHCLEPARTGAARATTDDDNEASGATTANELVGVWEDHGLLAPWLSFCYF